jgi:hypothetical protein
LVLVEGAAKPLEVLTSVPLLIIILLLLEVARP